MNKIIVGKITNTHGINGEVKIQRSGEEEFPKGQTFYVGDAYTPLTIERARISGQIAIVKFKEYSNINDVLLFKNQLIYTDEDKLKALDKDQYYIKDLLGLDVIDSENKKLGVLKDVLTYAANDVYVLSIGDREVMIPAVKEFVLDVDIKSKFIRVKLIEEM